MYVVLISVLLQVNNADPSIAINEARDRFARDMVFRRMEAQKRTPPKTIQQEWADKEANVQERVFISRFNNLLKKLRLFIDGYNTGKVDMKTVQEVQKAWAQVQKDGWFKVPPLPKAMAEKIALPVEAEASSCTVEKQEAETTQ